MKKIETLLEWVSESYSDSLISLLIDNKDCLIDGHIFYNTDNVPALGKEVMLQIGRLYYEDAVFIRNNFKEISDLEISIAYPINNRLFICRCAYLNDAGNGIKNGAIDNFEIIGIYHNDDQYFFDKFISIGKLLPVIKLPHGIFMGLHVLWVEDEPMMDA